MPPWWSIARQTAINFFNEKSPKTDLNSTIKKNQHSYFKSWNGVLLIHIFLNFCSLQAKWNCTVKAVRNSHLAAFSSSVDEPWVYLMTRGITLYEYTHHVTTTKWKPFLSVYEPALVKNFQGSLKILEDLHEDPSADLWGSLYKILKDLQGSSKFLPRSLRISRRSSRILAGLCMYL